MPLTKEDLLAIESIMDRKLAPVHDKLDDLQESMDAVRTTANEVGQWVEGASQILQYPYPVKKVL